MYEGWGGKGKAGGKGSKWNGREWRKGEGRKQVQEEEKWYKRNWELKGGLSWEIF